MRREGINTTWENLQSEKQKSKRRAFRSLDWFVPFRSADFLRWCIPRVQPHARSLFLFPIVFGINLIHFFDEKKDGAAGNSIVCFAASIPCHASWQSKTKNGNCFEECNVFGNEKCELSAIQDGRNQGAKFWQGNLHNSSPSQPDRLDVNRSG